MHEIKFQIVFRADKIVSRKLDRRSTAMPQQTMHMQIYPWKGAEGESRGEGVVLWELEYK